MKKKAFLATLVLTAACITVFAACGNQAEDTFNESEEASSAVTEETTDVTSASVPDAEEPSEPTTEAPVELPNPVTYRVHNSAVAVEFTLLYDENRNVTEVTYKMSTDPDATVTSEITNYFERFEKIFNDFEAKGGNVTCEFTDSDGVHLLTAVLKLTDTPEGDFLGSLLGRSFPQTIPALADVVDALTDQGFELFTE